MPALTAVQVIDEALSVEPGDTLLVNGAGLRPAVCSFRSARYVAPVCWPRPARPVTIRVRRAGAAAIVEYHNQDWPQRILAETGGRGADAAANAARGGAASAMRAVRDGGRLATITSDPPEPERGIDVKSVHVRPDAGQLGRAAEELGAGRLQFRLAARFPLFQAEAALARSIAAGGGAIALEV